MYETEVRAIDMMLDHMTDSKQAATEEKRREHLRKQRKRKILRLPQKQRRFSAALGMAVIRKFFRPGQ